MSIAAPDRTHVMVVEDDGPILRALSTRLKYEGFDVHSARDGSAALTSLRVFRPDVAVLDINMPGIDGIRLAREIRLQVPTCRLLFLTASRDAALREEAAQLGVHAFMEKPYGARELVENIRCSGF
ncbi:MAG: response regulator transcription factor [Pseudomonadales bacterium]